jgi:hypothetical protein
LKDDHFDRLFLLAPIKVSQRIIEVFRSGLGIPLYFLGNLCAFGGKKTQPFWRTLIFLIGVFSAKTRKQLQISNPWAAPMADISRAFSAFSTVLANRRFPD